MEDLTQTREIDGVEYSLKPLTGRRCTRMWYKLSAILASTTGELFENGLDVESLEEADIDLSAAVEKLLVLLPENEFEAVRKELFSSLVGRTDGKQIQLGQDVVFDAHMGGKVFTVLKIMRFALEVNFGDFLSAAREPLEKLAQMKDAAMERFTSKRTRASSPPASTT